MAQEAVTQRIAGHGLVCPICGHDKFTHRRTLLGRRALAIFDIEWAGRRADVYVCARCGHMHWFMPIKKD